MRALRLTRVIDKCPNIIAYKKNWRLWGPFNTGLRYPSPQIGLTQSDIMASLSHGAADWFFLYQ